MKDYLTGDLHAIEVITHLHPVAYVDEEEQRRLHLHPEHLSEVLPEAVIEYHEELVIDWSAVTVISVAALAEIIHRVEVLEKQLAQSS